jgi:hypothetical protein
MAAGLSKIVVSRSVSEIINGQPGGSPGHPPCRAFPWHFAAADRGPPADEVTIWYTVSERNGQEVISVQHVSLDT